MRRETLNSCLLIGESRVRVAQALQILKMQGRGIFNQVPGPSRLFQAAAFFFALALLSGVAVAQRSATRPVKQNAEQLYAQGVELARKGDPVRAAASFRSALRLKADFAEAHNALGLAL